MIGFNYLGKMGQLGNQMFQYATVLGISKYIETSFCIPNHTEVFSDGLGNNLRIELFDVFDIKPDNIGFTDGEVKQEKFFHFDSDFFSLDKNSNYNLVGYFQTEKYFKHVENVVREHFVFKDEIVNDCKEILSCLNDPVALHIRRGDYAINATNHHNLSLDYYAKSLEYFPGREVIIFTDDPAWAKEQDLFSDDRFLVSENNSSYHDLYMMSQCNDFIIANSTFSWWGAWLANTGKVIAPQKWFGPALQHNNTKDLYLDGWITL
jgi:hypothetical protein